MILPLLFPNGHEVKIIMEVAGRMRQAGRSRREPEQKVKRPAQMTAAGRSLRSATLVGPGFGCPARPGPRRIVCPTPHRYASRYVDRFRSARIQLRTVYDTPTHWTMDLGTR